MEKEQPKIKDEQKGAPMAEEKKCRKHIQGKKLMMVKNRSNKQISNNNKETRNQQRTALGLLQ